LFQTEFVVEKHILTSTHVPKFLPVLKNVFRSYRIHQNCYIMLICPNVFAVVVKEMRK